MLRPLRGDPGLSADGLNGIDDGLARKLLERLDRLAEELAEPRLPLLFFDGRVGEARHVSSPSVLQCALLVLRAVGVLLIRHVVLQDGVAGLALLLARGGDAGMRAVEHAQVLAPGAGRL